jgi:uncharacterized protein YjiS (DUF1127 family)
MWRSIRAGARRAAAWPFRVAAARATLRALASMDRRELADIGLSPSDVRDVSALALDRDPGELLARRARERRRDAFAAPPTAWGGDRRAEDPRNGPRHNRPSPGAGSGSPRASFARTG